MAREILGGFGPDTPKTQAPRITKNGPVACGDVHKYAPPKGPTSIGNRGPGLGGTNHGTAGTQGKQRESHSESTEARYYTGRRSMAEHSPDEE